VIVIYDSVCQFSVLLIAIINKKLVNVGSNIF